MTVEAGGQVKVLDLTVEDGVVTSVRADMGIPVEEPDIELHGRTWKRTITGNPHATTFVDDIDTAPVTELGPLIENDPGFPNRTNVEFAKVEGDVIHARFWERGVGRDPVLGDRVERLPGGQRPPQGHRAHPGWGSVYRERAGRPPVHDRPGSTRF